MCVNCDERLTLRDLLVSSGNPHMCVNCDLPVDGVRSAVGSGNPHMCVNCDQIGEADPLVMQLATHTCA